MSKQLKRCAPFINGSAYCGMLRENDHGSFGPDFVGPGPYYVAEEVDALIERLRAAFKRYAGHRSGCKYFGNTPQPWCSCGYVQALSGDSPSAAEMSAAPPGVYDVLRLQAAAQSGVRGCPILKARAALAALYQVLGALSGEFNVFDHADVQRALDVASRWEALSLADIEDLLPWPREQLTRRHPTPLAAE